MHRSIDMSVPALELLQQHWALVLPMMVVCGLTTTAILFCSHFHQIEGDTAAGKTSPLVRLGTETGCKVCDSMDAQLCSHLERILDDAVPHLQR